jgi:hypothetical protein
MAPTTTTKMTTATTAPTTARSHYSSRCRCGGKGAREDFFFSLLSTNSTFSLGCNSNSPAQTATALRGRGRGGSSPLRAIRTGHSRRCRTVVAGAPASVATPMLSSTASLDRTPRPSTRHHRTRTRTRAARSARQCHPCAIAVLVAAAASPVPVPV